MQLDYLFKVNRSLVELQDLPVNFDELTELEDDGLFRFSYEPSRPNEWSPDLVAALSIELSQHLTVLERIN